MCGISVLFSDRRSDRVDRRTLLKACGHTAGRARDGEGAWTDAGERVALTHRRLAIIDLSPRGAQPMRSAGSSHAIVFNRQIHNARAVLEGVLKRFEVP